MLRVIILVSVMATSSLAATPAVFRGRVVEIAGKQAPHGTIYVLGRNGSLRRVTVGAAQVQYADHIPQHLRKAEPQKSLVLGAEVRVEAEENGHGVWKARQIEILQLPGASQAEKPPLVPPDRRPAPTLSRRSG